MTLTEFLLARIAEDEDEATRVASDVPGATYADTEISCCLDHDYGPSGYLDITPTRVLAECEAKRRILDNLGGAAELAGTNGGTIARALALPYATHANYDPAWSL